MGWAGVYETNSSLRGAPDNLNSSTLVLLQDVAAIHDESLPGDIGGLRGSEEADRGGNFIRRARSSYRRVQRGDFFGPRPKNRPQTAPADARCGQFRRAPFKGPRSAHSRPPPPCTS